MQEQHQYNTRLRGNSFFLSGWIIGFCLFFTISPLTAQLSLPDSIGKARSMVRSGAFDQGIALLETVLPLLDTNRLQQAEVWHQIGLHHYQAGYLEMAVRATTEALDRRIGTAETPVNLGRSYFLRAAALREQSRLFAAAQDLEEAIAVLEAAPDDPGAQRRLPNMYVEAARINKRLGNFDLALIFIGKARAGYLQQASLNEYRAANLLQLEGTILDSQQKYKQARQAYEQAAESLVGQEGIDELLGSIANNYGLLLLHNGERASAAAQFDKAREAFEASFSANPYPYYQQELANIYANMARLYNEQERYDHTVALVPTGVALAQSGFSTTRHPVFAELYARQGTAHFALGNIAEARQSFERAIAALLPDPETPLSKENLAARTIMDRLRLLQVMTDKAIGLAENGLEEEALIDFQLADALVRQLRSSYVYQGDRSTLLRITKAMYEAAIGVALKRCETEADYCELGYSFIAKNKALLLLEEIQTAAALQFANLPEAVLLEEEQLRQRLLQLEYERSSMTTDTVPVAPVEDSLLAAKTAYYDFLKRLEADYPAYFAMKYSVPEPLTLAAVQEELSRGECVLDYFTGKASLFVATITNQSYQIHQFPIAENFDKQCFSYRLMLDNQVADQAYLDMAHGLYQTLLAPVLPTTESVSRLVIIPDGVLNLIAFEGLLSEAQTEWLGKNNTYVLRDFAVRYLYSNHFLAPDSEANMRRAIRKYAGFGLEYDDYTLKGLQAFAPDKIDSIWMKRAVGKLYYSDDEVQEATNLIGGQAWLNEAATKTAFLEYGKEAGILHFAMHGIVDERQPLNSALAFSRTSADLDFLLRAGDLYGIPLTADLAVLSACQTAYEAEGDNSVGLKSLARAFTYAGCESLVASLWNASDKSSKDIVLYFFEDLQKGVPKDVALQQAKLKYLEEAPPAFSHPSFWANLIAIGDSRPVSFSNNEWQRWGLGLLVGLLIGSFIWWFRSRR
jgi:CHAT domain-containing protein/Flp pilus assembly protein TadD